MAPYQRRREQGGLCTTRKCMEFCCFRTLITLSALISPYRFLAAQNSVRVVDDHVFSRVRESSHLRRRSEISRQKRSEPEKFHKEGFFLNKTPFAFSVHSPCVGISPPPSFSNPPSASKQAVSRGHIGGRRSVEAKAEPSDVAAAGFFCCLDSGEGRKGCVCARY